MYKWQVSSRNSPNLKYMFESFLNLIPFRLIIYDNPKSDTLSKGHNVAGYDQSHAESMGK